MIHKVIAFDHQFNGRSVGIHLCKSINSFVQTFSLFVFADAQKPKWSIFGVRSTTMCMESIAIHSFGYDPYAIGVDAIGDQHTAAPIRGHPDLFTGMTYCQNILGYPSAFKHDPLDVVPTEISMQIDTGKTDVDVIIMAVVYCRHQLLAIERIYFLDQTTNALYLAYGITKIGIVRAYA